MGLSSNLSCEVGVSPAAAPTPKGIFNQRFEALFPHAGAPGLCQLQPCLPTPQSATSLGLPAAALPRILSSQLPVSAPPTGLDECFFFISLVVRLPYSLIFCQFWLFFVFKSLLSFFWLCEEAQCVYLRRHLGSIHQLLTLLIKESFPIYIFLMWC